MINDIILEVVNALLIAGILLSLILNKTFARFSQKPGSRCVLIGFSLMLLGACFDITDEFEQLNRFVVIGDTPVEAFIEKFFGYMLGSLLLLLGIARILPVFAELERQRQMIETMVNTIPVPTFCKDEKGQYLACNQAFEKFLGLSADQILGKTVYEVASAGLAETYQQADLKLLTEGGRQVYEAQVQVADGARRDVLFNKAVFRKEDGSAGGIVGVMLDITAQKEVEAGLRRFDQMKSEFISTAAHELRTPLTSVQGYVELLLQEQTGVRRFTEAQQGDFLREIDQASDSLARLVDDLLDVGRIESGHPLPMDIQPRNPLPLLRRIVEAVRLRNPHYTISLDYELPHDTLVLLDEQRFRQVADNLLSNALKYSPAQPEIRIQASQEEGRFLLRVSDAGIGMSADQLSRIFDKFYRADSAKSLASGLGIGLSIAKSIVDAHTGLIRVDSEPGRGTLIEISLPLAC